MFLKCAIFISIMFLANLTFAQDMIILKTGDEIKSKVLEITPDMVKYKKWENQEGPAYSTNKSDVFMIKYSNGTKDVFNQSSNSVNQSTQNVSNENNKNEAFETLNKFFKNRFNNDKVFKMLDLDKSNGVMKDFNGQSVYEIEYKLKLEFISDAWVKAFNGRVYFDKDFSTYDKEPIIEVFGTTTSNSHLFNKGKIYIFSGTATMENTDNGYILKEYNIIGVDYMGMASKYSSQNTSEIKDITTTRFGYFDNVLKELKGEKNKSKASKWILLGDYKSSYTKNADWVQESIRKNLFYRCNYYTGYNQADFGKKDSVYIDDLLVVNKSDSLLMKVRFNNRLFLDPKNEKDKWIGTGEYTLSIQIADNKGIQYFINTQDDIIKTENTDKGIASIAEIPIKLRKDVLSTFPNSENLFLSFLIQDKKSKDALIEGFVKFQVR